MIKPIGQVRSAAIDAAKARESEQTTKSSAPAVARTEAVAVEASASPATRMAAQGAPIDKAHITRVKQAIASGNYPVDPDKIAEKMVDLDLPVTRH